MPPRAQRLYPRMRERPPEFRLNPAWPLYSDLVTALIATTAAHGNLYVADHRSVLRASVSWRWVPGLNRLATWFADYGYVHVNGALHVSGGTSPITIACHVWPQSIMTQGALYGEYTLDHARNYLHFYGGGSINFDQYPPSGGWLIVNVPSGVECLGNHILYTATPTEEFMYINGRLAAERSPREVYTGGTPTTSGWGMRWGTGHHMVGWICDGLSLRCHVPAWVASELADPSNVDIRIGGIPLILPPRRRLWPVAPVAEYVKRRQLGLRVGCREAVL